MNSKTTVSLFDVAFHRESQILQVGRSAYGRSVITPVNIPVDMVQKEVQSNDERPHCKLNNAIAANSID